MNEDRAELKERMSRLSGAELVDMFEKAADYRDEFIQAAREEIEKRGGIEVLRQRVVHEREQEKAVQPAHRRKRAAKKRIVDVSRLIPEKERFDNYPILRLLVGVFRSLAVLAAIFLFIGILAAFYGMLTSGSWALFSMLVLVVYMAVTAVGFLTLSEVTCILVDIERNVRRTNERIRRTGVSE